MIEIINKNIITKLFVIKNSLKTLNHDISIIVLVSMLLNASSLFISSCEIINFVYMFSYFSCIENSYFDFESPEQRNMR